MELTVLLNYILGGTSLAGIIGTIVYYKHNKRLKQNEVSQSDTKTQKEQINLGMQFIENSQKTVEIMQQVSQNAQNTDGKIDALTKTVNTKLSVMSRNQASMNKKLALSNKELELIKRYLNGNYQEFLAKEADKETKR